MEHREIKTTPEVWAVIRASHPDMVVFSSYSAPEGDMLGGDSSKGVMLTEYGIDGCDCPIIGARTTWDINPEKKYERLNEKHRYWLCVGISED